MIYPVIVQSDLANTLQSSKAKYLLHWVETRKKRGGKNELCVFDINIAVEDQMGQTLLMLADVYSGSIAL